MSLSSLINQKGLTESFRGSGDSTACNRFLIFKEYAIFESKNNKVYAYPLTNGHALKQKFDELGSSAGRLWGYVKNETGDNFEEVEASVFDGLWNGWLGTASAKATAKPKPKAKPKLSEKIIAAARQASLARRARAMV